MKNIDIISKVVGRKGEAMASPSKDAASFDLSGYLLKEVWDKCWEIRTTDQGEEYLFGKYPVAVQYGLTSYVDGKMLKLPSIYDGLPIDYQTLYWEETTNEDGSVTRVLKARGIGNSDGGGGNIPDLSAYVTEAEANALIKAAKGVILETWTSGGGNAITSISLGTDKKSLVIEKNETFATQEWVTDLINNSGGDDGGTDSGSLSVNSSGDGNAFTGYTYINGNLTLIKGSTFALQTDYGSLSQTVGTLQSSFSDMVAALGKKLDTSEFESWKSVNESLIANGDTAYGWGNHADAGYVTEDLVSNLLGNKLDKSTFESWVSQNGPKIANGYTAYGWGNHAEAGYVTEDLVSNLLGNKLDKSTFESWVSQNGPKIANGDTAYGWGNHADAGYVKSYNLTETLKGYVTVGGTEMQTITGKKNFAGGLFVNGQELVYNEDGYWKMEGNLLVTGGITNYSSDGKATPFLINVDAWNDISSDSATQVYSANAVTLLKNEVQSVGTDADSALAKLEIIAEELSSLTTSSYTADIRTALMNIATKIK